MPLYDFLCSDCGKVSEILVASVNEKVKCVSCGSGNIKKMLSAPSSLSGEASTRMPGQEIQPAAVLRQAMQVVPDQEVVAGKYHLKENSSTWTNIKRSNMMLY